MPFPVIPACLCVARRQAKAGVQKLCFSPSPLPSPLRGRAGWGDNWMPDQVRHDDFETFYEFINK